jgi:hypothetical protein
MDYWRKNRRNWKNFIKKDLDYPPRKWTTICVTHFSNGVIKYDSLYEFDQGATNHMVWFDFGAVREEYTKIIDTHGFCTPHIDVFEYDNTRTVEKTIHASSLNWKSNPEFASKESQLPPHLSSEMKKYGFIRREDGTYGPEK